MNIDSAIDKLNEFKRLSNGIGECDLVSLTDDSFTVKIQFGESAETRKTVLGFAEQPKKTKKEKAK